MKRLLTVLMLLVVAGCAPVSSLVDTQPPPDDPDIALPEYTHDPDGSLFNANYNMALFQDRRAFRVGDILTVSLDEKTRSSKQADTSFGKESDTSIGVPLLAGTSYPDGEFGLNGKRDFKAHHQAPSKIPSPAASLCL